MNFRNHFFILFGLNIILLVCGTLILLDKQDKKIVYVENIKVFENFAMTHEMKKRGDAELKDRQQKVDSLYLLLNNPSYTSVKENIMQSFIHEKEELENFTAKFAEVESAKIWNRIYGYANDFSEHHGYEIILGTQPNENIIYGGKTRNVTVDFVNYINNKYEGN
jgi:outer membrane protein